MNDMDMGFSLLLKLALSVLVNGKVETKPVMERSDSLLEINTLATLWRDNSKAMDGCSGLIPVLFTRVNGLMAYRMDMGRNDTLIMMSMSESS